MRIAIDSGGTFTDCLYLRDGRLQILKVPSRPNAPAEAILEAVQQAIAQAAKHSDTKPSPLDLVCGTTVGTNALLERRGGRVALITTAGFEDVLEIGRQARTRLYDLFVKKIEPLVPQERRIGAHERLAADGAVVHALKRKEISRLLQIIKDTKPDSVALCLLFSFRNSRHEKQIATKLRAAGYSVSVSHEILPEFREYERTSTTVINAYLAPVMSSYLRETTALVAELSARHKIQKTKTRHRNTPASSVRIMQSNGGIISAEEAAREPVRTILSGPAGGVIGAAHAGQLAGLEKCISFDMGGTSTDVALLSGELHTTTEATVAGLPVAVPMLEIHTVGAGGGSIARFDAGGALRVGPESAGAVPGPICYGRGTRATVTDAHAVLGHLGNAGLLGGSFSLAIERARTSMQEQVNTMRGSFRTVEAFAHGILAVANAVMEKAIRVISIERGHDPRDYSLIAFGGAGGLHACALAAALELRSVLIPVFPGGLSALGILSADVVKEFSRTVLLSAEKALENPERIRTMLRPLQNQATRDLLAEGFAKNKMHFRTSFDLRYVGQAFDLNTLAEGNFIAAFHQAHEQRYGCSDTGKPVEIVNVRCRATGITDKLPIAKIPRRQRRDGAIPCQTIESGFDGKIRKATLYPREYLRAGDVLTSPAVVTEYSGTTLILPGWHAHVDEYGQLLLARK